MPQVQIPKCCLVSASLKEDHQSNRGTKTAVALMTLSSWVKNIKMVLRLLLIVPRRDNIGGQGALWERTEKRQQKAVVDSNYH
jgi:hypothetical protein